MKFSAIVLGLVSAVALSTAVAAKDCAYEKCLGANPVELFTSTELLDRKIEEAPAAMPFSPCWVTWGGTPASLQQRGIRAGCHGFHPGAPTKDYSDGYKN